MPTLRLAIPMKARAKARPRVPRWGKAYMPPTYVKWKEAFATYARAQVPSSWGLPTGKLYMSVTFFCKGKCTPDFDNGLGSLADSLQGIAYANDKQIRTGAFAIIEDTGEPDRIQVEIIA